MKSLGCRLTLAMYGVVVCALPCAADAPPADNLGFKVPDGFEVSLYAGDDLAHDITCMTIDAQGRVVVAGPGYVKILHSDNLHGDGGKDGAANNGEGKADRAILFSDKPKSGAMGLYFDGRDLICSGDSAIWRLRDSKGEDHADSAEVLIPKLGNSEHGAHAIIKGPDGWFYCVCGNDAGVSKQHITTETSPVKEPVAGAIIRFSPDGKQSEVFAHGFRNPYCIDFNATGNLFTVDSDNERDHYLPWYAPCRLFDVAQGMNHGWLNTGDQHTWNRPASFFDSVERMCEIGRGSPTGLVCYRHYSFPEHYRGGLFSACWTLGKIYYFPLTRKGSTFETKLETFLEPTGNAGFAPTALAVGPAGELFVSVGGRGTRGSVYKIRYTKNLPLPAGEGSPKAEPADPLTRVLRAPQPLSSWSRAKWEPEAKKLGAIQFMSCVHDMNQSTPDKVRAIEILTECFNDQSRKGKNGGIAGAINDLATNYKLSDELLKQADEQLLSRIAWSLGRRAPDDTADLQLVKLLLSTSDRFATFQRNAWESYQTFRPKPQSPYDLPEISKRLTKEGANADDRRVRAAAFIAMKYHEFNVLPSKTGVDGTRLCLAKCWTDHPDGSFESVKRFDESGRNVKTLYHPLEFVRCLQIEFGDFPAILPRTFECGYAPKMKLENWSGFSPPITTGYSASVLASAFPTDSPELNRELARTLGLIGSDVAGLPEKIVAQATNKTLPQEDIHYLIVLSLIPGKRTEDVTKQTAEALANLHRKMNARGWLPSRNWPLRVGELFEALVERDPKLPEALGNAKAFGLPEHSLFVLKLKGREREELARKLLAAVKQAMPEADWTPQFIECLKSLPRTEYVADLRARWDEPALRDAIAAALAEQPDAADRERFVQALGSIQSKIIEKAANVLATLPREHSPGDIAAALRALRRVCQTPQDAAVRQAVAKLLSHWSGEKIVIDEKEASNENKNPHPGPLPEGEGEGEGKSLLAVYQPWFDWFAKTYPDEAAKLRASTTYDEKAWMARLAKIDFDRGDTAKGKLVFERRNCSKCHQGSGKLGPELVGAAARFSREDLFTAILDPSKDVAPQYRQKIVTTTNGETYTGLIVYQSPEGVLLQTGPETQIRVTNVPEGTIRTSAISPMPTGLLNDATDQELADLYAYLRTLKK